MSDMTDDEKAANQFKRPLYAIGTRVRVIEAGSHHDWRGVIEGVKAYQNMSGFVKNYIYDVRMDNLSLLGWAEQNIEPEEPAPEA